MRIGSVLFLTGVFLILQLDKLPSVYIFSFIACILLFLRQYCLARLLAWFMCGCVWTIIFSSGLLNQRLLPEYEGKELDITGKVISLPDSSHNTTRFNLAVSTAKDRDGFMPSITGVVRLSWYSPTENISANDILNLKVKLKRPHGFFNPGGFDYESWLFREKIIATGYVINLYSRSSSNWHVLSFNNYRTKLKQIINKFQNSYVNASALAGALLIGDRSGLSEHHRDILFRTGTAHLIAISGLHIGLIAAVGFAVVRLLWSCTVWGILHVPAKSIASMVSLLWAIGYAGLAGFSVPTQRAVIMITLALFFINSKKQFYKTSVLAWSLLIILLINPLVILSPGFWLSFIAVLLIILAINSNLLLRLRPKSLLFVKIQIFIFIGMLPISIYGFNQISLITILANIFSVPLLGTIILPVLFLALFLLPINIQLSDLVFELAMVLLDLLWSTLKLLETVPNSFVPLPQPNQELFLISIIGVIVFLLSSKYSIRLASLLLLLPLLFNQGEKTEYGDFTVTVLDVGQGLAVSVQTENHVLLYDTGPGFRTGSSAGNFVILPYFLEKDIKMLDSIIISHSDNDHIGGVRDVIENIDVGYIYGNKLYEYGFVPSERCHAGINWVWDGITFDFLHPGMNDGFTGNNSSCVLKIGNGEQSFLIAGDIEYQAEDTMIDKYNAELKSNILLAPHHGSNTSSKSRFIRAVNPENVIFSTGYLNRFNLPNQDIIMRYIRNGANVWNTATDGAIHIEYRGNKYNISTERQKRARFWNG